MKQSRLNYTIILIYTLLIELTNFVNPFSVRLPSHDSSMFLYFGWAMNKGLVFYKELFDHKGPLLFIINAIGQALSPETSIPALHGMNFSFNFIGNWIIEFLFVYFAFICLYRAGTIIANQKSSIISMLIIIPICVRCFDGGNFSEIYALPFISISLLAFIKYFYRQDLFTKFHWVLIGISGTAVLLLRLNMIAIWITFLLAIEGHYVYSKNYKKARETFLYTTLGVLIIFIPVGLYCIFTGSFYQMINQSIFFNIVYSSSEATFKSLLNTAAILGIEYSLFPIYFVFTIYLIRLIEGRDQKNSFELIFIIYFILNLVTIFLSARPYFHYVVTQIPAFFIVSVFAVNYLVTTPLIQHERGEQKDNILPQKMPLFLLFFILIYSLLIFQRIIAVNREPHASEYDKLEIAEIIYRTTSENNRIYVHSVDGSIYLYSNRLSATKYFCLPALNLDNVSIQKEEFILDIDSNKPQVIVVLNTLIDEDEKNNTDTQLFKIIDKYYVREYSNETLTLFRLNSEINVLI